MIVNLKGKAFFADQAEAEVIEGYPNGCFSVLRTEMVDKHQLLLFEPGGNCVEECVGFDCRGAVFRDERYILFNQEEGNGAVYGTDGCVIASGFKDFTLFANDWYVLDHGTEKILYRADGTSAAYGFIEARVFEAGFALKLPAPGAQKEFIWELFFPDGAFCRLVPYVRKFLGNGFVLAGESDDSLQLTTFGGEVFFVPDLVGAEALANGCFVVSSSDSCRRMFTAKGKPLNLAVQEARFLPDGTFFRVDADGKPLSGLHHADGHWSSKIPKKVQTAASYYLLDTDESSGLLYDDKGHCFGANFQFVSEQENFALFERAGNLLMFNQFAHVLSLYR